MPSSPLPRLCPLVAIVGATAVARAETPIVARLGATTDGTCAVDEVAPAIQQRVRRAVRIAGDAEADGDEVPPDATLRVALRAAPDDGGRRRVLGQTRFFGASGTAERLVEGSSCAEVVAAIGLLTSTWLEAEPRDAPDEEGRAAPLSAPGPTGAAPRLSAERQPSPRERGPNRLALGVHAVASTRIVGEPTLGGGVSATAPLSSLLLARASLRVASARETTAGRGATYAFLTLPVEACARTRTAVTLAACARVEGGVLRASVDGDVNVLPWFSAGAGLRGGVPIARGVALEVEAFASTPLTGWRVGGRAPVLEVAPSISPSVAAGAVVELP